MKRYASLAIWIALCLGAGAAGSLATSPKIATWYATLEKPAWNPPTWLFGPVWTTLYILMGVAAWIVWERRRQPGVKLALWIFGAQLALNAIWSFLFFGMENPALAFSEIVLLWLAIAATIALFHGYSHAAAWLLAPYLAWVSFASVLNFAIWRLNA